MRSDYALYIVAVIFFLITTLSFALATELERNLWIVTTTVLGLLFLGLGYTQRPKIQTAPAAPQPAQPTTPAPTPIVTETVKEEKMEPVAEIVPSPKLELTAVKGIKAKRSEQLKSIGISNVEELANASAEDVANKLKISPKITGRWIEEAKRLTRKS
ncbi:helix-hairpin-helix domain-containing protein [Candidatus Bathyarchaeota archaeon]|nr:helix-hairpin-helix domain-containing protein [Candidatus Bathyarchaeota archaeon]